MILKCAIIDDEPLAAELLASYAKRTPELNLTGVYNSAVLAMKELRGNPVDILFLDIQMPEISGLEFAGLLPESTRVVFTTAFDRYAVEGFKVNAADYLLKPVSYESFVAAVSKVAEWFGAKEHADALSYDKFVYIKSEYKLIRADFNDIVYVEGVKDYVKFYFGDKRKPIMSLINMKRVEDCLPNPPFMRVHRSFIANMAKVDMIDRSRMVVGGVYIPISESYKEQVQAFIDKHSIF